MFQWTASSCTSSPSCVRSVFPPPSSSAGSVFKHKGAAQANNRTQWWWAVMDKLVCWVLDLVFYLKFYYSSGWTTFIRINNNQSANMMELDLFFVQCLKHKLHPASDLKLLSKNHMSWMKLNRIPSARCPTHLLPMWDQSDLFSCAVSSSLIWSGFPSSAHIKAYCVSKLQWKTRLLENNSAH